MAKPEEKAAQIASQRRRLLGWYESNRRDLPWRRSRDPYAIWVSEIMLQQTRVAVVVDRYPSFMQRFPTLISLALATEQEVLALWSGLGYYSRARMLHKAAQFVAANHAGNLPVRAEELRMLPGIGAYTAAAIASIAHGEPVAVVDGNVERVICRLAGWSAASRKGGGSTLRRKIENTAQRLLEPSRPGDFNQAMMELGATVCTPRSPQCEICPLREDCKTKGEHKTPKRSPMSSHIVAYALSVRMSSAIGERPGPGSREVLLVQRPDSVKVMPGMWELPMLLHPEVPAEARRLTLRHSIMRVNYYVQIRTVFEEDVETLTVQGSQGRWVPLREAATMALTGLTRKVLARTLLLPSMPVEPIAPPSDQNVP